MLETQPSSNRPMLPVGHVWLSDAMSKIVAAGIKTVPSDHVAWIIENVLSARLQAHLTGEHGTFVADIHGLSHKSVTMAIEHGPTEHEFGSGSLRGWLSVIEDELLRRAARKPLRESEDHIWYRELTMFLGETAIRALIGELRSGTRKAIAMCSSGARVDLTTDHWAPPLSKGHRRSFINFRELVVRGRGQFTLEQRVNTITVTYGDGSREKFSANWLKRPGRLDIPDQNMEFMRNWSQGTWRVLVEFSEAEIERAATTIEGKAITAPTPQVDRTSDPPEGSDLLLRKLVEKIEELYPNGAPSQGGYSKMADDLAAMFMAGKLPEAQGRSSRSTLLKIVRGEYDQQKKAPSLMPRWTQKSTAKMNR